MTVVGGVIKWFEYRMIPFILAENPTLKANETIQLSRMMMKGHKWECCKLELSFLGWDMLSVLTLGLTGIFYSAPYKACAMAEYYVYVRQCSLEADLSYQKFFKDTYLYRPAIPSLLQQAYPEGIRMHQKPKSLGGIRGFLVNWFGILLKNGKEEKAYPLHKDPYIQLYFHNYTIRPSCFQCPFCTTERNSDITLGDFWGVEKIRPEIDDRMGVSLVMTHSEKGEALWSEIRKKCVSFECEKKDILQPRLQTPTERPARRAVFMTLYRRLPFPVILWMFRR